ncbi:hypothetical protein [Roseomonas chloroacetimidivorans]|jgi:hypothetical protein|uniref:hypothetical protein n=1 Tax=Roseomonas chloroacetimidivorans TaxID=1766656 RepID=UPI003C7758B4
MKAGAIALIGLLTLAPAARAADVPLFVNATMCDVAAPISSSATVFQREVRAERRVPRRAERHAQAQPRRRAPAARPAPQALADEVPMAVTEPEPVLRPAVHYCVGPAGSPHPVRYT